MSRYYPLFADLSRQKVLVVGGGSVALRKVQALLRAGAEVWVIAPSLTPGLARLTRNKRLHHLARPFRRGDIRGFLLVIAATDDPAVNRAVSREAQKAGRLVNVVDVPELCTFIVPSTIAWGDLTLAISTGGASPAFAKRLRQELEARFGEGYGRFLKLMAALRPTLLRTLREPKHRQRLFTSLAFSDIPQLTNAGKRRRAAARLRGLLAEHLDETMVRRLMQRAEKWLR